MIAADKTIVLTGTFSRKRPFLEAALRAAGLKTTGSVSSKVDIVFSGEKGGSKLAKAQELGLTIYDEDQLDAMMAEFLEQGSPETPKTDWIERLSSSREALEAQGAEIRLAEATPAHMTEIWPEMALARAIGLPEEILGFFKHIHRWRLNWRMPSKNLHAGKGAAIRTLLLIVEDVIRPVIKPAKVIGDIEAFRSKSDARVTFMGLHGQILFEKGEYRGMVWEYHPGGVYECSYLLPFKGMDDFMEALLLARALPNWPMLLTDHKKALASDFFSKGAEVFDDFDPSSFRERFGAASLIS